MDKWCFRCTPSHLAQPLISILFSFLSLARLFSILFFHRQHQPLTTSDSIAPIQIAQYENWMVLIFCVYFAHVNDFNIENVYYIYRL